MIIDNELRFADGTWAPTAVGNNISPNVLDTGPLGGLPNVNTGRDLGTGDDLTVIITVKQTATSGGGATVDFRIRTDSNANLTTSPVDLASTGAIAVASLTAGYQVKLKLPPATYKRYLGLNAVIGTAVLTAGMFEAEVVKNVAGNTKYAGAFNLDV